MLTVIPIPAFNDNYIWLIRHENTAQAMVVDPGDAAPVLEILQMHNLHLEGILITHHHPDHMGGIENLLKHYRVPVYGPDNPAIDGITHILREGDTLDVLGQRFEVLEVPGHTLDHIAYYSDCPPHPLLFCGDTLFSGGCGRLFEGTAQQMYDSLQKLARLPANTAIFPAHEYTLANLQFAQHVEPGNSDLQAYLNNCTSRRAASQPTLPTHLGTELAINPFLRSDQPTVQQQVSTHCRQTLTDPVAVFRETRRWKDNF